MGRAANIPTDDTDDVYGALVNSFANSKFVMFGSRNEPGNIAFADLVTRMSHAVEVIRAGEDRLGVPPSHHRSKLQRHRSHPHCFGERLKA